ncbi:putative transposase [Photobacterium profundum SS9]|uniref:Transposase n=1 Tax=Photobacterium profundum (strain SS9) TaxID=298386 RepID=Q6LPM0_PHOPR|nr:putative transposase [Photobacterium profundum SS9]
MINEAQATGARQSQACKIIGLNSKTIQRWKYNDNTHDKRLNAQRAPKNKLTDLERQHIINVANEATYANLPPNQIVPILADKGIYLGSESTFYRILKAHKLLNHRQRSKPCQKVKKPKALVATGPNQVYTWDITYLPTTVKGLFFYLYMVMDVFSRKVVGWQVHDNESSALAADLMTDICKREDIKRGQVVLHSDNGSPMKGATMLATLQELGVMPSLSRPSVSNDNPYSESLFRTLKYRPEYPEKAFLNIASSRRWVDDFVCWYNNEHRHSGIKFVTPAQRHTGRDIEILAQRTRLYHAAKARHPERWSGNIKNLEPVGSVYLTPEKGKANSKEVETA